MNIVPLLRADCYTKITETKEIRKRARYGFCKNKVVIVISYVPSKEGRQVHKKGVNIVRRSNYEQYKHRDEQGTFGIGNREKP